MAVHYYNVTNNTGSPILLPSNQLVDATATVQITLHEYRSLCEKDDIFLDQIYSGDLSVTFGAGQVPVHVPIPSDGTIEVLRNTDKIKNIEVDPTNINDQRVLTYTQTLNKLEYKDPTVYTSGQPPDSTSTIWFDSTANFIWMWDNYREKWISSSRVIYSYGKSTVAKNEYLNITGLSPTPSGSGYYIFADMIILGIYGYAVSYSKTPFLSIRDTGVEMFQFTLPTPSLLYINTIADIDMHEGDVLQIYVGDNYNTCLLYTSPSPRD